jgi:hypothetical protein
LVLVTTPVSAETLVASVVIAPTLAAATLPAELMLEQRYLSIAMGAKALLLLSEYPWANAQQGMFEQTKFDAAIAAEQLKRAKGNSTKRLHTKTTFF